jgi:hypothetical protein
MARIKAIDTCHCGFEYSLLSLLVGKDALEPPLPRGRHRSPFRSRSLFLFETNTSGSVRGDDAIGLLASTYGGTEDPVNTSSHRCDSPSFSTEATVAAYTLSHHGWSSITLSLLVNIHSFGLDVRRSLIDCHGSKFGQLDLDGPFSFPISFLRHLLYRSQTQL